MYRFASAYRCTILYQSTPTDNAVPQYTSATCSDISTHLREWSAGTEQATVPRCSLYHLKKVGSVQKSNIS